ncbi:MAG: phosphomannose isomerase type II C-terminal cupin domain [Candidatus Thermoplasmatota archaeon]|nr:phosphomannose isomerase type II C-terminal cupin domain [Candidatus Thermoplasmatota archaeon]
MKEDRPWGSFIVVYEGLGYKVKVLEVGSGHRLSYQSHAHRSERWYILRGRGRIILDGEEWFVAQGEFVDVPLGSRHRLENPGEGELIVVEVQFGDVLEEDDIVRYEDDYRRETEPVERDN